jgi:hypothetical protein
MKTFFNMRYSPFISSLRTHKKEGEKCVCQYIYLYLSIGCKHTKELELAGGGKSSPVLLSLDEKATHIVSYWERERERESDHFHIQHEYLKKWRVCVSLSSERESS